MAQQGIKLSELVEKMDLKNLTPDVDVDLDEREVNVPDVNRPALQLAGFYDRFDSNRVQIIGNVEDRYVHTHTPEQRLEMYDQLLQHPIPCIVFCRSIIPEEPFLKMAVERGVPIFSTVKHTSEFTAEIIRWMNVRLAPCISIHGVLVDVYGVGVLIMGESGIGKSEAALELIKRGHRLVTDDVVEIRKVSDETLVGTAPNITKHFIELRGIGIVDVRSMFGVQSVRETSGRPRISIWSLRWKTGAGIKSTTVWGWRNSIRNSSETRSYATASRSVRDGIWRSSWNLRR